MADFDLIQTDAQVQSILNDGQNMQGAGAQTTLTTESVLLKDVNGNYHKILKSSFTEAIRDTLAGILVNNDKGTTISQIAAIASGDFGSITPANLASVLGGNIYRGILDNKDLNNITTVGCYSVQAALNRPIEYWGQLNVVALDNNAVAQYFTTNTTSSEGSSIYFRKKISSSWSSWLHLDNFGCSTPEALASLLGGVQALAVAEEGTTCSKIKQTSAIVYSNNQYLPSDLPIQSQGILLTFAASVSCKIQIYVCQQMNYGIYIRYQWFSQAPYETWSIWKQIQYEA